MNATTTTGADVTAALGEAGAGPAVSEDGTDGNSAEETGQGQGTEQVLRGTKKGKMYQADQEKNLGTKSGQWFTHIPGVNISIYSMRMLITLYSIFIAHARKQTLLCQEIDLDII